MKIIQRIGAFLLGTALCFTASAQQYLTVEVEEMNFPGFPAFHSGAIGEWDGKWIVIGGRANGLHGFYPPLAFPTSGINEQMYVIDPHSQQIWSYSADSLSTAIREAVTSSNMVYAQRDSMLYMAGGYGWHQAIGDFKTYPTLTAVNLRSLSEAIMSQQPVTGSFRQLQDTVMAVCGAHLQRIDSTFYLVWGHRFDGAYDRLDTTGFFVQQYTYQVRRFKITDDGSTLSVQHLPAFTDSANFRRRDYNLVPQIFADGTYGFTGFSGVFQKDVLLPHLNSVDITPSGYTINNGFQQLLNNYHTACMPVYDSVGNVMHTLFFGGTAQYYVDSVTNQLVEDTLVPFVNTISHVRRNALGFTAEYVVPQRMPGLLGTNAEFLPSDSVSLIRDEIIRLNPITSRVLAGYIVGGMESPAPNISEDDPSLSFASNRVFKVYIQPSLAGEETLVNAPFTFTISPNPTRETARLQIQSDGQAEVEAWLFTAYGTPLRQLGTLELHPGSQQMTLPLHQVASGTYLLRLRMGAFAYVQKLVVAR